MVDSSEANEILCRIVGELGIGGDGVSAAGHREFREDTDVDRPLVSDQVAGDHEPVAAVVAGAAQDRDRFLLGM